MAHGWERGTQSGADRQTIRLDRTVLGDCEYPIDRMSHATWAGVKCPGINGPAAVPFPTGSIWRNRHLLTGSCGRRSWGARPAAASGNGTGSTGWPLSFYDSSMDHPPPEVARHYEMIQEGDRIAAGLGQLELLRVQEVLGRYLPAPPSSILDVGGATGIHAEWLASRGHNVHVVDLMPHHVEAASQLVGTPGRVSAEVGDARDLPLDSGAFDAVLLFGPLYHLTERDDRLLAWAEAQRVVRPAGFIFAAAISRFASLFDGLARGFVFDPTFRQIVERDLREGQHRNPTDNRHWFTTAYFHHPDDLREEAEAAGAEVVELVGVEGLAGWLPQLADQWSNPEGREAILHSARAVESEPSLLGLSAHLIAVTRRGR
jgi:SAM-dependent methyltransferase